MILRNATPALIASAVLASIAAGCSGEHAASGPGSGIRYIDVPAVADSRVPKLSVASGGLAVLNWVEPTATGHALRFSTLDDGAWSEPHTVAEGDNWFVNWADFPSVVPVSDYLWGAHWLVAQPDGGYGYDVSVSLSTDGGRTWSRPVIPHSDGTPTEHGFVSIYPHASGVGLVWLDGRNMMNDYDPAIIRDGMTLRGAVFDADGNIHYEQEIDSLICDCCQTDVAVTRNGPVAVYRDRNNAEIRDIYLSRLVDHTWESGHPVSPDEWEIAACPVNGPAVAARDTRVAVAWFTGIGNVPRVRFAVSHDSGKTFQDSTELESGENFGRVGIALLDDDAIAISWLRKKTDQTAELVIARVNESGETGPTLIIGQEQTIPGFSFPQLGRRGDDLVVAWTSETDDVSRIHSATIPISALKKR